MGMLWDVPIRIKNKVAFFIWMLNSSFPKDLFKRVFPYPAQSFRG